MKEKELIKQLKNLGRLAKIDEDFKIRTRWHLERLVRMAKPEEKPSFGFVFVKKVLVPAFLALILLLGGSWVTATLAEKSNPGDTLYPVKRMVENARLFLVRRPILRAKLRQELAKKRFKELKRVLPAGEIQNLTPRQQQALIELKKAIEKLKRDYQTFKKDGLDRQEIQILLQDYQKIEQRIKKERIREKFLPIRRWLLELEKSSL